MVIYTFMAGGAAAAALGKTLAYAHVLGPDQFGLITLAYMLVALGSYLATFGVQDGFAREVPILRGRQKSIAALRGTALVSVFIGASVVGIAMSWLVVTLAGSGLPIGSGWLGPFFLTSVLFNFTQIDLQVREQSAMQAGLLLAKNVCPLIIIFLTGSSWSAVDVLALEATLMLTLTAAALLLGSEESCWRLDVPQALRLSRAGMPFLGSSVAYNLSTNLDRWIVQYVFGVTSLGIYAFAMQAVTVGLVVLNITQMYQTPRWLRLWASNGDHRYVLSSTMNWLRKVAGVCVIGAILALLIAQDIVQRWWPGYEAALPLLPWVAVGAIAVALGFFDVFFLAANAGGRLAWLHFSSMVFLASILAISVWIDATMEVFAIAFSAARILTLLLGWSRGRALFIAAQ